jgi:arylsulfatase A-like enzyme
MLGHVLRSAGYATHGLTTNVWVAPETGLDIGFDSFDYISSGREERMNGLLGTGPRAELAWAGEGFTAKRDDGAAEAATKLRRLIEAHTGQPSFWFVNLSECHSPYLPPRPWNDLTVLERMRAARDNRLHLTFESICLYAAGRHEISGAALERLRHLYLRAVSYMDAWLAEILEALDAQGILDDTLVIVTSDHGENFGEDGLIAHGFSLNERLIHVPLVMAGPGAVAADELVGLDQLPRIICEAAGIAAHPYERDHLPPTVAVSQYDPIVPPGDPRLISFAEKWDVEPAGVERLCARFTSATDGTTKLVLRDGQELVYDLSSDPGELNPIPAAQQNGTVSALRDALRDSDAQQPPEPLPAGPVATADDVADIERRMRLLGYM